MRRKKRQPVSTAKMPSEASNRERLNKVIRGYRRTIKIFMILISSAFIIHIIMNALGTEAGKDLSQLDADIAFSILQFSFVMYSYCWYCGCNQDLSVQNDIHLNAPNQTLTETVFAVLLCGCMYFLFRVKDIKIISVVLLSFLLINVVAWVWLKKITKKYLEEAVSHYSKKQDTIFKFKARTYEHYMFGNWQWWRFFCGVLMVAGLGCLAFDWPVPVTPTWISKDVVFSLCTLSVIVFLECWMWYQRLKLKIEWDCHDKWSRK